MPNPYENRSDPEGTNRIRPLTKIGLETPLSGRFWGENKRLVFSPPTWYQALVSACFAFGVVAFGSAFLGWGWVPFAHVGVWVGPTMFLAGVWALLSMEYVVFDLKSRTYFRREGEGLIKRTRRGSITEIDAVVVYCENYPYAVMGRIVIYRIVIHWKHAQVPLLVAERVRANLPPGAPFNYASSATVLMAQRYANTLGVKFFDNSYFHSRAPQSPI